MSRPGPTAAELGVQGFGAMRLRDVDGTDPDRDPIRVINAVLDSGVRMIDTADAYGNEELVGRAIRSRRGDVTLASKFGLQWRGDAPGEFSVRSDRRYVRRACEASLRRLGTDWIDLYYLHHRSDTTPIEETAGALAELVHEGKVRGIGLSNVTADDLRRAHAVHPVSALQEKWSLLDRELETELLPVAIAMGVAVVAHSPTSHGELHRRPHSGVPAALAALAALAEDRRVTVGQVALAWVHHREPVHGVRVVPLPGSTRADHAVQNVAAAGLRFTPAELRTLDGAAAGDRTVGD